MANFMNSYNPGVEPNKEEWLSISESERIAFVREFHESYDSDLDDKALSIHSAIHVVVENQLAMGVELLPETIAKLMRQGLDRHEALHAIGAIVTDDIMDVLRGVNTEFSPKKYRKKLEKMTAKRWKKGQY